MITVYYLVTPRKGFKTALKQSRSNLARLLAQPSLWTRNFGASLFMA